MKKETYMQSSEALGTTVQLWITTNDRVAVEVWFATLWRKIADFDQRFTRFTEESELSRFNRRAGKKVHISDEFRRILLRSKYFSAFTGGVFNPFVLPNLQRAGYVHSMNAGASRAPDLRARTLVGYDRLEIGDTWARIPADVALDLGGIGKGYLADELGEYLSHHTKDFCLSLGGDMCVSGAREDGPWTIDVQGARDDGRSSFSYTGSTARYGIATSGMVRSKLGKTQHHLIDPRSGLIARSSYDTCTVAAADATRADVFASCILIEGEALARTLYASGQISGALLQSGRSGRITAIGEGFHCTDVALVPEHHSTYAHV